MGRTLGPATLRAAIAHCRILPSVPLVHVAQFGEPVKVVDLQASEGRKKLELQASGGLEGKDQPGEFSARLLVALHKSAFTKDFKGTVQPESRLPACS